MASAIPPHSVARPRQNPAPFPRSSTLRPLTTPTLSVVIVNYCQWRNTARLVRQLLDAHCARTGLAEVIVVDNHSPRHPLRRKLRRWPGVTLRCWRRNRGFAKAVNEGGRIARGEWVFLLNPDMSVPPNFLDSILAKVTALRQRTPQAGIVGFQLRNPDGTRQGSAGPFPTLWNTFTHLLLPRSRRKCQPTRSRRKMVPWVTGCCLAVHRDCWTQVQGFDEDFFLYYEDVDLCQRARALGWSVWYEPSPRAVHRWPLHARRVPAALRVMTRHALLTYGTKHWPAWHTRVLAQVVRWEAWCRQQWAWFRGRPADVAAFAQLQALSREVVAQQHLRARARLLATARQLAACSSPQDGR
jgi:GT2 family glycosyltransferase